MKLYDRFERSSHCQIKVKDSIKITLIRLSLNENNNFVVYFYFNN